MEENKESKENREEAILQELSILADIRKRHEWMVFTSKEAMEEEKALSEIESQVSGSEAESPEEP